MSNRLTSAQRYNKRMDEIFENARRLYIVKLEGAGMDKKIY